jgi:hypothetical protein
VKDGLNNQSLWSCREIPVLRLVCIHDLSWYSSRCVCLVNCDFIASFSSCDCTKMDLWEAYLYQPWLEMGTVKYSSRNYNRIYILVFPMQPRRIYSLVSETCSLLIFQSHSSLSDRFTPLTYISNHTPTGPVLPLVSFHILQLEEGDW